MACATLLAEGGVVQLEDGHRADVESTGITNNSFSSPDLDCASTARKHGQRVVLHLATPRFESWLLLICL